MYLSNKEEIQLKLDIIHQNTFKEEEVYLATIKANVKVKWPATLTEIDNLLRRNNG